MDENEQTYRIVRFFRDKEPPKHRKVINEGFTLEQAQKHCNDPKTRGEGWFDGYEKET